MSISLQLFPATLGGWLKGRADSVVFILLLKTLNFRERGSRFSKGPRLKPTSSPFSYKETKEVG